MTTKDVKIDGNFNVWYFIILQKVSAPPLSVAPADDASSGQLTSSSESECDIESSSRGDDTDVDLDISYQSTDLEPPSSVDILKLSASTELSTVQSDGAITAEDLSTSPLLSPSLTPAIIEDPSATSPLLSPSSTQPSGTNSSHQQSENQTPSTTPERPWYGLKLCGDNLDDLKRRRHMRCDQQNESLHYFQSYAVKDRLNLTDVSDVTPTRTPTVPEVLEKVLPTDSDDAVVQDEFAILVARMMCENMQYFKENYSDVVQNHIPHKHVPEMSSKSEVVRVTSLTKYI